MPNGLAITPDEQVALLRRIQGIVFPTVEAFTTGAPGASPALRAAIEAFQQQTLPVIQQQFQLQGLQGSPALGIATGRALTQALVPLLQQEQQLRLQAAGLPIQVGGLSAELGRQAGQERIAQAEITSREAMLGRQLTAQEQAQIRELAARRAEFGEQLAFQREAAVGRVEGAPTLEAGRLTLAGQELTQREQLTREQIAAQERSLGRQLTAQEQAQIRELALTRETLQGAVGGTPTLQARQVVLQERLEPQRFAFQQETGREQLTQSAAQLAAGIAATEQERALRGLQVGGQLILGLTDPLAQAARLTQARQELAFRSIGAGGELQRSIAQEVLDKAQADFLRRQALSEQATMGLFGGAVLPPTLQQVTTTRTGGKSSSK